MHNDRRICQLAQIPIPRCVDKAASVNCLRAALVADRDRLYRSVLTNRAG